MNRNSKDKNIFNHKQVSHRTVCCVLNELGIKSFKSETKLFFMEKMRWVKKKNFERIWFDYCMMIMNTLTRISSLMKVAYFIKNMEDIWSIKDMTKRFQLNTLDKIKNLMVSY